MKIPFQLRPAASSEAATAFYLPSERTEDLVELCLHLYCDPELILYRLAQGFLIQLPRPRAEPMPGVIRLRSLAPNLYLPVNAELLPALLADEASALTRLRGLVFLPGGRVLEFAPAQTLSLSRLVRLPTPINTTWEALPAMQPLADELEEVVFPQSELAPDDVLKPGGEGIGTEEPKPERANLPSTMLGRGAMSLGKGMAWLGKHLNLKGLSQAGGRLIARAMAIAPQLTEAIMNKQEAALRALLDEFQKGNIDKALRRALPLSRANFRGASADTGANLPTQNLSYSLDDLLTGIRGPARIWYSRSELLEMLRWQYRQQAERAFRTGDYKRAAFIYGKLLGDFAAAANVLSRGGLHRDAAVLYLKKLGEPRLAAREYEAAGMIDRALELYEQHGEYLPAAELLRRLGEEDRAVAMFCRAAERLVERGQGYCMAGDLLLKKAGLPALAIQYYEQGWQLRPQAEGIPCARRLAEVFAAEPNIPRLQQLVREVEDCHTEYLQDTACDSFFQEVAEYARKPALAPVRDDLHDSCLMALGSALRRRSSVSSKPGNLAAQLFGRGPVWPAALVSDAEYAALHAAPAPQPERPRALTKITRIRGRIAQVTAVTQAPVTGDLFLGFESGEIFCFRPRRGDVLPVGCSNKAVTSLATSLDGIQVAALWSEGEHWTLASFQRESGIFNGITSILGMSQARPWLCNLIIPGREATAYFVEGTELQLRPINVLVPKHSERLQTLEDAEMLEDQPILPHGFLILLPTMNRVIQLGLGALGSQCMRVIPDIRTCAIATTFSLNWVPILSEDNTLRAVPVSSAEEGDLAAELVTLDEHQALAWGRVEFADHRPSKTISSRTSGKETYRAATLMRPGHIVAVTSDALHVFRIHNGQLHRQIALEGSFSQAVACFPDPLGDAVLVVCQTGDVIRATWDKR